MAGEKLHEFDLQLCDYVLVNFQDRMTTPSFAVREVEKKISIDLRPFLAPEVPVEEEQRRLVLNDSEFTSLELAVEDDYALKPLRNLPTCYWECWDNIHRRYV